MMIWNKKSGLKILAIVLEKKPEEEGLWKKRPVEEFLILQYAKKVSEPRGFQNNNSPSKLL